MNPQSDTPYTDALAQFAQRRIRRLDTPGHQIDGNPWLSELLPDSVRQLDLQPLLEGIDYGPAPTPLDKSLELAAAAWGARRTWFLTNGASQGNVIACIALRNLGTGLVAQRSVHSSVIDGIALTGLDPVFVFPSHDAELGVANGVTPEALDVALRTAMAPTAAYVVTPSYFGAVADVKGLSAVAHRHGVPLVVDEAWGAHFGFHPDLPVNANRLGADLVISSTHKLGGSLTQTAMLHLSDGPFAEVLEPLVDRAFRSMQSTSWNSILLASLDLARRSLATGEERITQSLTAATQLRAAVAERFPDISPRLLAQDDVVTTDPLHVGLHMAAGGISGHEARARLLDQHDVHCEIASHATLVALVGAGSVPDVSRIAAAFLSLPHSEQQAMGSARIPTPGVRALSVREAYFAHTTIVSAEESIGRISADAVAAYPPGIPNLLPGELITSATVEFLQTTAAAPSGHVRGALDPQIRSLRVVAD